MSWKDYFIGTAIGIMSILSFFTIIDWTIERDSVIGVEVAVAFIGALLGGAISGGFTFLGVKKTIDENSKSEAEIKQLKMNKLIRLLSFTYNTIDGYQPSHINYKITNLVYDKRWGEYIGEIDEFSDDEVKSITEWFFQLLALEEFAKSKNTTHINLIVIENYIKDVKPEVNTILDKYSKKKP